jgi:hypothetical protein
MKDVPYSGQLNRRVEFFENTTVKNSSGEPIETEQSLGSKFVERLDAVGNEEEDGRLVGLAVCRFRMRFNASIFGKGSALFIRDFDGDWEAAGSPRLLDGRKRYMEFKCRKRGEN